MTSTNSELLLLCIYFRFGEMWKWAVAILLVTLARSSVHVLVTVNHLLLVGSFAVSVLLVLSLSFPLLRR